VAPPGDDSRNFTHIRESLLDRVPIPPANVYPMPVERTDLVAAAAQYAQTLAMAAGTPPVLDLVHLGLGPDGHTASLVPHDPVLGEDFRDVGLTQPYQGHRRMTLTYPIINRARCLLFVVTGSDKIAALAALRSGDRNIPAAHVTGQRLVVMADAAAAGSAASAPSQWDRPAN
jgi:6-phosphogluconolactonase